MGSEYRRDREKGTLEISQTQFIRNVVDRFGITKTSPIPGSPSLELRYVNDEEPVVDANVRENLGSLMWIAKQTRLDYAQKAEDRRSVSGVVGCCDLDVVHVDHQHRYNRVIRLRSKHARVYQSLLKPTLYQG